MIKLKDMYAGVYFQLLRAGFKINNLKTNKKYLIHSLFTHTYKN